MLLKIRYWLGFAYVELALWSILLEEYPVSRKTVNPNSNPLPESQQVPLMSPRPPLLSRSFKEPRLCFRILLPELRN